MHSNNTINMKTWSDFYEEVVEHYKDLPEVKCYEKGGECNSDSDFPEDGGGD